MMGFILRERPVRSILKGGEVMDSGVSCHIHSLIEKNYIKRGIYHEQRYFLYSFSASVSSKL